MNSHIVAALACLALANGAQAVDKAAVRETIEVKTGAGKVLVQLFAENTSGKTVYLPRALYSEEELFHSPFELSSGGFKIDYIGPMVKRGPFTQDDYLPLKPGARHTHTIDITRSYAFLPGAHTYELRYNGAYLANIANLIAVSPLPPASAKFSYTPKPAVE
jgi:hypothetical protein